MTNLAPLVDGPWSPGASGGRGQWAPRAVRCAGGVAGYGPGPPAAGPNAAQAIAGLVEQNGIGLLGMTIDPVREGQHARPYRRKRAHFSESGSAPGRSPAFETGILTGNYREPLGGIGSN
jgi:hypothetical protein